MSILTPWGYSLPDADEIPGMMTLTEFNAMTAEKYLDDTRVEPDIKAATAAIRNFCGWHVCPSQACQLNTTLYDKAVTISDRVLLIQLPATFVSAIESIQIGEETIDGTFVLMPNGVLRVFGLAWSRLTLWTPVVVNYTAGLPEGTAEDVMAVLADRVTHALASSEGVQSETAGGVSVTYNAEWANGAKATALADDTKEVLSHYRLRGVF